MLTLTWLHLSDLHWRGGQSYDEEVVLKALLRDLAQRTQFAPELAKIDLIFVTGDIAFASRPEEYTLARKFLRDLAEAAGIGEQDIFFIPGNHDVDRATITDEVRAKASLLTNRQAVNRLLNDEVDRAVVMQRFHSYKDFSNEYHNGNPAFDSAHYFFAARRVLAQKEIAILGLNSVWNSASDGDRNHLLLGERQVREAIDQAEEAEIRIALMHHPFEWLEDFDREDCEPLLLRHCHFILRGHLHKADVRLLQVPGSNATVIAAGAGFETREYLNAYNLVQLNLSTGWATVYLRLYSDQRGGFWTKDVISYPGVEGQYKFELPRQWIVDASLSLGMQTIAPVREAKQRGTTVGPSGLESVPYRADTGLDRWWCARGYSCNPFIWSNAADVEDQILPDLFQKWYVDPNMPVKNQGLGDTPTLDWVESLSTSRLVLLYVTTGGGKTFYRRWASRQMEKFERAQYTLEISNLAARVPNPKWVTGKDLTLCLYHRICEEFSIEAVSAVSSYIEHVLEQCEVALKSCVQGRVYILLDDLDQLFDEQPASAQQNAQALGAIVELCAAASKRSGGESLALRIFVPMQLRHLFQERTGMLQLGRIGEHLIAWNAEHCETIIERRLDSYWLGHPDIGIAAGPDTGQNHLNRLLSVEARAEFRKWLEKQVNLSPRSVINIFDELGDFAYGRGISSEELIHVEDWNEFVGTRRLEVLCAREPAYPFS
jgi:predicted MPP superfamily phosphohydrolase